MARGGSRRGEGHLVAEMRFRLEGQVGILHTLYEAANRQKLKLERAWRIPRFEHRMRSRISPVMAVYLRITGANLPG